VFRQSADGGTRTLTLDAVEGSYVPPPRPVLVRFMGCQSSPSTVRLGDTELDHVEHLSGRGAPGWAYDGPNTSVIVSFPDSRQKIQLIMQQ
jgi:hypothetical protein